VQVPYQTKAERERARARWMTLTETLNHISGKEVCDPSTALSELKSVLSDGLFRQSEMRWADRAKPPFGYSSAISPDDTPAGADWHRVRFRLKGDGTVLDDWNEYGRTKALKPRWRKLLLLRQRAEQLWPPHTDVPPWGAEASSHSNVVAFGQAKQRGPRSTKKQIEDAALQLISRGRTPTRCGSWEDFRRELCDHLNKPHNARGFGPDTVQKAVRPILASLEKAAHSTTGKTERSEN
jgi:hypothetical protein